MGIIDICKLLLSVIWIFNTAIAQQGKDITNANVDHMVTSALCDALDAKQEDMKVDLRGVMSYEDTIRFMTWRLKNDFQSDKQSYDYGTDTNWKRPILNAIFNVVKKACPEHVIPHGLLNIIKEFNLIYQNSLPNKTDNSAKWDKHLDVLHKCLAKVKTIILGGSGHYIDYWKSGGDDIDEDDVTPIVVPQEFIDKLDHIDPIIDTMWWVFVNALGECHQDSKTATDIWSPAIKSLFYQDFLEQLTDRWIHVGAAVDFGLMVGDYPFDRTLRNLRSCVTAIYSRHDIKDRQPPRPISAVQFSGSPVQNKNTKFSLPYITK